jgi:DNA-directed RNA polymerase specialized sigma24 family protein
VADVATELVEGGRIHAALRRLSERDREVLQFVGWEELDAEEQHSPVPTLQRSPQS